MGKFLKNKTFKGSMTIGSGHSILTSNTPSIISNNQDKIEKLMANYFKWSKSSKESLTSFGFWGGDIDYNTYYPELPLSDLKPKDEEFIEPIFRLLSATIVSKNWNPTDFSKPGVLKASMNLLLGQTVNCDHETNIGNAIGSVSKVIWQEEYKDGDLIIPAGINGVLKIDGKANPRIARGILMEPPSIHSNSVTIQFLWDKSHPELEDSDFFDKLGTYDKDGNLICRVVTEVVRYLETSLVSHGADAFAQKIGEDGKIINPEFANRTWNSYGEYQADIRTHKYFYDLKSDFNHDNLKDDTQDININNLNGNKEELNEENLNQLSMNELELFLASLFGDGMLVLQEGKEITQAEVVSLIQDLVSKKSKLEEDVKNLTTEKVSLEDKVNKLTSMANLGTSYVKKLRESVINNFKKISGDKFDEKDPIYQMLISESTPILTLEGLNKGYEQRLEELFPLKCSKCGSRSFSRASSKEEKEEEETVESNSEVINTEEATRNILSRKNKYQAKSDK